MLFDKRDPGPSTGQATLIQWSGLLPRFHSSSDTLPIVILVGIFPIARTKTGPFFHIYYAATTTVMLKKGFGAVEIYGSSHHISSCM